MNLFEKILSMRKLDKADEGGSPDGNAQGNEPQADGNEGVPPGNAPAQEEGDTDEFGYPKKPESAEPPGDKKPTGEPKKPEADPEKAADASTGYDENDPELKEPEKKAEEDPEKKPEEKKPAAGENEYGLKLEDFSDDEAKSILEKAKSYGMSKEGAAKFAADRKAELEATIKRADDLKKANEGRVMETRRKWMGELKADKTFGGENFAKSVAQVEKLVAQMMPGTKKLLTESKSMLPPGVMRDLKGLADRLYGTKNFVQGDPEVPPAKDEAEKSDDPLAFYNS